MKKSAFTFLVFLPILITSEEKKLLKRITKFTKVSQKPIDKETIQKDHQARFHKRLSSFITEYEPVYGLLENLNAALTSYSSQPLNYQTNYQNIAHFDGLINQIKQKDLTIAITKLLHYKTYDTNQDAQQANLLINNLKKIVSQITTILATLASNKTLLTQFTDNPPEKIAQVSVADYFKNYVTKQFTFKTKKLKRSLTNWESK